MVMSDFVEALAAGREPAVPGQSVLPVKRKFKTSGTLLKVPAAFGTERVHTIETRRVVK